jgi:SAM-dependent methyltransferase
VTWYHAVAERDHELQNPTSEDKIRLAGSAMRLDSASRVLDVAAGRGGPAIVLAQAFGCRLTCVERAPEFAAAARGRVHEAGLEDLVRVVEQDAREFPIEEGSYDAALCLGASFVWKDLAGTLDALAPAVRAGGYLAVGEPFWRRWPLPEGLEAEGYVPLAETVEQVEEHGLPVVALVAASEDDWDRYESLHWRSLEEWLVEHPDVSDADAIGAEYRRWKDRYLRVERDLLGWAIFVAWKRT